MGLDPIAGPLILFSGSYTTACCVEAKIIGILIKRCSNVDLKKQCKTTFGTKVGLKIKKIHFQKFHPQKRDLKVTDLGQFRSLSQVFGLIKIFHC